MKRATILAKDKKNAFFAHFGTIFNQMVGAPRFLRRAAFSPAYPPIQTQNWNTAWLPISYVWAHKKIICQQTIRAKIILRPSLESSRQGEFRSSGFHFLWSFFGRLLFKTSKNMVPTKKNLANFDLPPRVLIYQGLVRFWGASNRWQIDFLVS